VTPEGRFLVFESRGDLTLGDTRTDGSQQIFRYDADPSPAEEAAHVPGLVRVSIGRDGFHDDGNAGTGNASIVGGSTQPRGAASISNDGSRVFFESPIGLTPQALDDDPISQREGTTIFASNVYEWEQAGAGSCPAARSEGCVFLISDGRDTGLTGTNSDVRLLGTDTTGDNVFFSTSDQLVKADTDTQLDIYDARVCEPSSPCIAEPPQALPPCLGEQCHGIPEPTPSLLAPGTATFNGEGNIAAAPAAKKVVRKKTVKCKKPKKLSHGKCVKSKTKKTAKKSNRRAK
jgi:hypothetical protein